MNAIAVCAVEETVNDEVLDPIAVPLLRTPKGALFLDYPSCDHRLLWVRHASGEGIAYKLCTRTGWVFAFPKTAGAGPARVYRAPIAHCSLGSPQGREWITQGVRGSSDERILRSHLVHAPLQSLSSKWKGHWGSVPVSYYVAKRNGGGLLSQWYMEIGNSNWWQNASDYHPYRRTLEPDGRVVDPRWFTDPAYSMCVAIDGQPAIPLNGEHSRILLSKDYGIEVYGDGCIYRLGFPPTDLRRYFHWASLGLYRFDRPTLMPDGETAQPGQVVEILWNVQHHTVKTRVRSYDASEVIQDGIPEFTDWELFFGSSPKPTKPSPTPHTDAVSSLFQGYILEETAAAESLLSASTDWVTFKMSNGTTVKAPTSGYYSASSSWEKS
jgi:hypothetical protein